MNPPVPSSSETSLGPPIPSDNPADDVAIRVDDVWKRYRTGQFVGKTLARDIQSLIARLRGKEDPNKKMALDRDKLSGSDVSSNQWFWALKGVSFEVKKGEVLSILGRNGAGKSTLLQLISQITEASEGVITINGRVASLLQAGVGFSAELTGRENIFLNGTILGLHRDEVIDRIPDIAEFSEIEKFLDTPVKRYSSGMVARLGFAVAAHLGADILILDEVFAVGDIPFREKCIRRIIQLASSGTTILVVTHMPKMLKDACDRCIVLSDGCQVFDGHLDEGVSIYKGQPITAGPLAGQKQDGGALEMRISDAEGRELHCFPSGLEFRARFKIEPSMIFDDASLLFRINCQGIPNLIAFKSPEFSQFSTDPGKSLDLTLNVPAYYFNSGEVILHASVKRTSSEQPSAMVTQRLPVIVDSKAKVAALIADTGDWRMEG